MNILQLSNVENKSPSVKNTKDGNMIQCNNNEEETECLSITNVEARTPPSHKRSSTPLTSRRYNNQIFIYDSFCFEIDTQIYLKLFKIIFKRLISLLCYNKCV